MRRLLLPSLLAVLVLTIAVTQGFDAFTDPFVAEVVRIDKEYYDNGQIANETSFNRFGEMHGLQVHYDPDGSIREEFVYARNEWQIYRRFDYGQERMHTTIGLWTPPYSQSVTESMPETYRDFRSTERTEDPAKFGFRPAGRD